MAEGLLGLGTGLQVLPLSGDGMYAAAAFDYFKSLGIFSPCLAGVLRPPTVAGGQVVPVRLGACCVITWLAASHSASLAILIPPSLTARCSCAYVMG